MQKKNWRKGAFLPFFLIPKGINKLIPRGISDFKGKKDIFGQKKPAGAELKKKKRIFGPKIGKKFENKARKLSKVGYAK